MTSGVSDERGIITRVATGLRYTVSGTAPEDWFWPAEPLPPMAPPEVAGRGLDVSAGGEGRGGDCEVQ
jgi:hypothetical protein